MAGVHPLGPTIGPWPAFRHDREALLEVVGQLTPAQWTQPTVCGPWLVRDLVAHLVGDDLGHLSRGRDQHTGGQAPRPGEEFPAFIDRLNHQWVVAAAGMSPRVLAELLATTTPPTLAFWDGLDLTGIGESVSWAGPEPALRWLDCARDFAEYWAHQR